MSGSATTLGPEFVRSIMSIWRVVRRIMPILDTALGWIIWKRGRYGLRVIIIRVLYVLTSFVMEGCCLPGIVISHGMGDRLLNQRVLYSYVDRFRIAGHRVSVGRHHFPADILASNPLFAHRAHLLTYISSAASAKTVLRFCS